MFQARLVIPALVIIGLIGYAVNQMQPVTVHVAPVETGQVVEVVYATGTVQPDSETKVAPEVAGRIVALAVDEGDLVRAGQLLARLDDADARLRVREAERRLETARARLAQTSAPTDPFVVQQVEAQVRAAQERQRGAQERAESGKDRVATARNNARAAETAVQGARAKARAFHSAARSSLAEIEAALQRVEAARADVGQAQANVDSARDLYDRRQQLLKDGAIAERQVTEARTSLQAAEAALQAARARVVTAEKGVAAARANSETAQAQAEDADTAVETAQASLAAAQSQVTEAENAAAELRRQAEAQVQDVEAVRSQLRGARRGRLPVDVQVAQTEVRTAEAALAQSRQELTRYTVLAPVSGRVTNRPVDPGDYAAPGTRLFTLANEQRIYVRADVDESDIGQVRLGSPARFQVDAMPGRAFTARVALIGRAADRATKTYPVDLRGIDNPVGLRIGMTADVNVQGRTTAGALLVPTGALQTEKDRTQVWVMDRENRARPRPVRIKAKDVKQVQVIEGLLPGERVVLNPTSRLQEGRVVKVAP